MTNIHQELESLGLSGKEAAVYIASLELGPTNVQQIADRAEVKRVTVYPLIESLQKRGLMSSFEEGKKTLFVAEDPTHLVRLIEQQEQDLKKKKDELNTVVEELESRKRTGAARPTVRLFDGVQGLQTIQQDFTKAKYKDFKFQSFTRIDAVFKLLPKQTQSTAERVKRKITSHIIYTNASGPIEGATNPVAYRVARYIPLDTYPFEGEVTVYGDTVILASYEKENPVGVKIEDKGIAKTVRALFSLGWKQTESQGSKTKPKTRKGL